MRSDLLMKAHKPQTEFFFAKLSQQLIRALAEDFLFLIVQLKKSSHHLIYHCNDLHKNLLPGIYMTMYGPFVMSIVFFLNNKTFIKTSKKLEEKQTG